MVSVIYLSFYHQTDCSMLCLKKKRARNILPHNSRKCGPMLIIFSFTVSFSALRLRMRWYKIYQRTCNMLPHYLGKTGILMITCFTVSV